jgi:hypothetical protein
VGWNNNRDYDVGHEMITSALAGSGAWWEPTDDPPHPIMANLIDKLVFLVLF